MEQTIVGREIRRADRNLLLANFVLAAAVLVTVGLTTTYWYNFCFGPFELPPDQARALTAAEGVTRYFVHVSGQNAIPTGWQDVERRVNKRTGQVTSEKVTADYTALVLDDKLLVVKHDPGASPGHQAIGRLIDVPDNLRREFIAPTVAKNPDLADAFLPVMIDATGFRTGGYVMLALGVPAGLLAAWNLRRSLARRGRPDWHPVAKSLLRYGLQDDVARQIDDESQNPDECVTVGKLKLTKSWLLLPTTFGLKVRHLGEAVWAYKTVTKHSVNFIPTGKTYAVVCHFRDGSAETITVRSEVQSEDVVLALFQRVPWMLAGYGDDIQQAWKRNRPEVLNAVEARRQHLLNTADQQGDEAPPPDGAPADEGRDEG